MRTTLAALMLLSSVGFVACADSESSDGSRLQGTEWRLVSLVRPDGRQVSVGDPSRFTVSFVADGSALARADCNSCFGSWSASGSALSMGPIGCTKMYCGDESLDRDYLAALGKAKSFEIDGDNLTISSPEGELHFRRS